MLGENSTPYLHVRQRLCEAEIEGAKPHICVLALVSIPAEVVTAQRYTIQVKCRF
jgi:hypothetical protein